MIIKAQPLLYHLFDQKGKSVIHHDKLTPYLLDVIPNLVKRKCAEIFSEEESASFHEAANADVLDESEVRDVIQNLSQFLQTRPVDATQGEELSESLDLPSDPVVPPQSSTPCPIQFEEEGGEPTVIEETESFVEFPCGKCNKEVSDDDDAILCDGLCQCWLHLSCTNLSNEEFVGARFSFGVALSKL